MHWWRYQQHTLRLRDIIRALRRLTSPATRLFDQGCYQADNNDIIKDLNYWSFVQGIHRCHRSLVGGFPVQKAGSNVERFSFLSSCFKNAVDPSQDIAMHLLNCQQKLINLLWPSDTKTCYWLYQCQFMLWLTSYPAILRYYLTRTDGDVNRIHMNSYWCIFHGNINHICLFLGFFFFRKVCFQKSPFRWTMLISQCENCIWQEKHKYSTKIL